METKDRTDERIPMFVESPRGDDKIGTGPDGALISDHVANETGTPFEPGVPQKKIQAAVETHLKDEKWVVIEKKDGSSELLTKGDIPEPEVKREIVPKEKTGEGIVGTDDLNGQDKPPEDDWRKVFSVVPVKQKSEPKPDPKAEDADAVKPALNSIVKSACTALPKKEKETWTSKFENIKSATATHKGKGG